MAEFELICCVVDDEKGSRTLRIAKHHGVKGGTVFIGRGTAKSKILDFLDLNDSRKEIVWMCAEKEIAKIAAEKIAKEMSFHKKGFGIAFTIPLSNFIGTGHFDYEHKNIQPEEKSMYNAIFTVVEKGRAEEVIDAAAAAGSKGGTIWGARGSGIHETEMLFSMPIEPEREIVMIISEIESTEKIASAINKSLKIDKPGNGIIFISSLSNVYGLS